MQTFTEYPLEGVPSLTRHAVGAGAAWYLATFPDRDGIESARGPAACRIRCGPCCPADQGVELTRRRAADGSSFLFAINHTRSAAPVQAAGTDLLTGERFAGTVEAGGVAVIAED